MIPIPWMTCKSAMQVVDMAHPSRSGQTSVGLPKNRAIHPHAAAMRVGQELERWEAGMVG